MALPRKNESSSIPSFNNIEDTSQAFPEDWFILGKWINFQSLKEEGFDVKGLFDRVGRTSFLENFNTWHYGPYALFWETARQDGVNIKGTFVRTQVVISLTTIIVVSACALDGLTMSKDWEKEITLETMDKLLYGKPHPDRNGNKALNTFLRIANLTYLCRMIHNVLFNTVMPRLHSRHYVSDRDHFCICKIMVGEKVNLSEIIFFY